MKNRSKLLYRALFPVIYIILIVSLMSCNSGVVENNPNNSSVPVTGLPKNNSEEYSLTILSTNDIHGHFDTMPQYATIVKQVREERKNVLLLDAGDIFKRGKYENYQGKIEMEIANAMGYDAMVLGNNEFKVPGSKKSKKNSGTLFESDSQISNLIKWAEFPILCGNVKITGTDKYMDGIKPYVVEDVNGLKVAIIGITSTVIEEDNLEMAVNKDFISGETAVQQLLPEVKSASDIQIVLSHVDMIINNKIEGVSAIISGHDHISTQKPLISNGIPIIQAGGEELHYLGRLDLNFRHKDGKWVNYGFNGRLYSADGVEKDKEIQRIIDNYKSKPISKLKSKK